MRLVSVGKVQGQGGVEPGPRRLGPRHLGLIRRWRNDCTLVVTTLDRQGRKPVRGWQRPLAPGGLHDWQGIPTPLDRPSVVPGPAGTCYVLGGGERLWLEVEFGTERAAVSAALSPTAAADLSDGLLIVAEGQRVTGYRADGLGPGWQRPTPRGHWALTPAAGPWLALQDPAGEDCLLWNVEDDRLWALPDLQSPAAPLLLADRIIVPGGAGGATTLLALDPGTGEPLWRREFAVDALQGPPAQGPFPLPVPLVMQEEQLIVATAEGISALDPRDGRPWWQTTLAGPISSLASGETLLVATRQGRLLALDEDGRVVGEDVLASGSEFAAGILARPGSVLAVGHLGGLYRLE